MHLNATTNLCPTTYLTMKFISSYGALELLSLSVSAFPRVTEELTVKLARSANAAPLRRTSERAVSFDPAAQLVEVC
jgi:hypothetical protein